MYHYLFKVKQLRVILPRQIYIINIAYTFTIISKYVLFVLTGHNKANIEMIVIKMR